MKEQMNQGVSREELEAVIRGSAWGQMSKRLARAHLALLDKCENLRRDKERLDAALAAWERFASACNASNVVVPMWAALLNDEAVRLTVIARADPPDAEISENAANAKTSKA